jgi:homoserine dehydrogenase
VKKGIMVGFGNVGKALAKELISLNKIEIIAVITSKGVYKLKNNWRSELNNLANEYPRGNREKIDILDLINEFIPDIAFVTIPPSYYNGEPNLSIYNTLIDNNINIITADKTGLALEFSSLMKKVKNNKLFFGYRATVMAGTPAIDVAKGLRGRNLKGIKAVLNATTNYILSLVESGYSMQSAIDKVKELGLVEPDPKIDIDGYDAAAKLSIILNTLDIESNINEIKRESLLNINEEKIRKTLNEGKRIKYIAYFDGNKKGVHLEEIEMDSQLARVSKNYNCILFNVDNDTITLTGPAGPAISTAKSMITDVLEYLEKD